jgi:hypothetical protein
LSDFLKTGFWEHLGASLLAGVIAHLIFRVELAFLLAFVTASLAPDIDHPKSKPRKFARVVAFLAIFLFAYFFAPMAIACLGSACPAWYFAYSLLFSAACVFAIEFFIPKHRGKMHSKEAGLAAGLLFFVLGLLVFPPNAAALFGISGALGYLFHLAVDHVGDRM